MSNLTGMTIRDNRFIAMFALIIVAWAVLYQDALLSMEAIWARSDTFAHGYFILPISLWLLWRDKENLLGSQVKPSWLALPFLFGSLFVWLFAYAADINVLGQLSAVVSLICLTWFMVGNNVAWHYKFPLAYLLFAVPMGENLIPWLQDVTAWFTVFFLDLNGIPFYRNGLYIEIPTGMFEVAVACSGIRYLIASVAVGTLFGYLTYNKTYKQILFVLFAMILPILANGIRAYGIVAIAYYSDMKYATGADHLIYGWLFFGFVIMLMFWIGGFFADKAPEKTSDNNAEAVNEEGDKANKSATISRSNYLLYSTTLVILCGTLFTLRSIPTVDLAVEQKQQETSNSSWGISFVDAIETRYGVIRGANNVSVEAFKALYGNKQTQGELIVWQNVTHNHDLWTIASRKEVIINNEHAMLVNLRNSRGFPRSYLYQYKIGDYFTVNANKAKLMQAWNSLTQQSDFSEIRAVSVSGITDLETAEKTLIAAFNKQSELFKDESGE
ncbi:exosortase A [Colwellia sp. D2M02]|uniref:exosortase A n=1 Tax=Colwellia sp. D2M02 TaxID=2841562 RepID=UPI001C08FD9F|nr:exosortase A [Colwellia sp. D2M02]MBU2894689.1 exosortase A [Colwellia sp. D2M02]